jgi:hypothetical protein
LGAWGTVFNFFGSVQKKLVIITRFCFANPLVG